MDSDHSRVPNVWLVTAYRAGEREQILALAEALGWPFEVKEVSHRKYAWRTNLLRGSDLGGIAPSRSSPLQPPWPDLVISAGMRNEPVCRWIRRQSGGHTRIVHIGRPWAKLDQFDLVITTPQYRLPERPNVLQNTTTLHRISGPRLEREAARWKPKLAHLPTPYIAVILGGNSGPYTFGPEAAKRLAAASSTLAEKTGASLLVTSSARTSPVAVQALLKLIKVPAHCYQWRAGDTENPYFGYLALADEIIVTADSISMLTEACATCKPVHMFDPGTVRHTMRRNAVTENGREDFSLSAELYNSMMKLGPQRLSRDIRLVHDRLIKEGRAVWLGDAFPESVPSGLPALGHAVQRVQALFSAGG